MELPTLKIDREFKDLISPLQKFEYKQLEENILQDGCLNPIITWKGIIVDGHNRYEICEKHNIPFTVLEKSFSCRAEVISWICKNQLGRRNIPEETRKYLIGKQYQSQKQANQKKNPEGYNQYIKSMDKKPLSGHKTAVNLGKENNVTFVTISKYATYSKAIDDIGKKCPAIVPKILSGKYKISHENILMMATLPKAEIKEINKQLKETGETFIRYSGSRNIIKQKALEQKPSVKDMPKFDPDASSVELILTIPSWAGSINRVKNNTDLTIISQKAKERLTNALNTLKTDIEAFLSKLEGAE